MLNVNEELNAAIERVTNLSHESKEFGFYWVALSNILNNLKNECDEVKEAIEQKEEEARIKEEVGDLVHAALELSIFVNLYPINIPYPISKPQIFNIEECFNHLQLLKIECDKVKEIGQLDIIDRTAEILKTSFELILMLNFNPTNIITLAADKYEKRLACVKMIAKERGFINLKGIEHSILMNIWDEAKQRLK